MAVRALKTFGLLVGMSLVAAAVTAPVASAASAGSLQVLDEIGRPAANVALSYAPLVDSASGVKIVGDYETVTSGSHGSVTLDPALAGSTCVINTKPVSLIKVNGHLQADARFNCTDPQVEVQLVRPSQPTTVKVSTELNSATAHIYAAVDSSSRWVQVESTTVSTGRVDFYTIPGVVYTVFITPPTGSDYYPQFLGGLPYEPDTAPGSAGTITSVRADGALVVSSSLQTTGPVVIPKTGLPSGLVALHVTSLWGGKEVRTIFTKTADASVTIHGLAPTPHAFWAIPAFGGRRSHLKVTTPNKGTTPTTVSIATDTRPDVPEGCLSVSMPCDALTTDPRVAGSVQIGDRLAASFKSSALPEGWLGSDMNYRYYWSAALHPAGGSNPDGVLHPVGTDSSIEITPDLLGSPLILKLVTVVTPKSADSPKAPAVFTTTALQTWDTYKPGEGYANDAVFANITPCAAPVVVTKPKISGKLKAGSTITTTRGTWSKPMQKLTYQWTADGQALAGATSYSLDVTKNLEGKRIGAVVTMTPPGCLPASVTVPAGKVPSSSHDGKKAAKHKRKATSKIKIKRVIKRYTTVKIKVKVKSKRKPVGKIKVKTGKRKMTKKLTRRMHGKATVKIKHLPRGHHGIKVKFKGSKKIRPSKWAKVTVKIK